MDMQPTTLAGDVADRSRARYGNILHVNDCAERLVMLQASPRQQNGERGDTLAVVFEYHVGERDMSDPRSELV